MAENPRIEEFRRRVEADPASIAFAVLAEEYRRSGAYQDAINTCRAGLQRHPSYLSARVTLARALIEVGDLDAARQELDAVLKSAPENLAAMRAQAEIDERIGHGSERPGPVTTPPIPPTPALDAAMGVADWTLPSEPPATPGVPDQPAEATPVSVEKVLAPPAPGPANEAVLTRLESLLASIQGSRGGDRHA